MDKGIIIFKIKNTKYRESERGRNTHERERDWKEDR
jgi:hypothetical protein